MRCLSSIRALTALARTSTQSADLACTLPPCLQSLIRQQLSLEDRKLGAFSVARSSRHYSADTEPDPDEVRVPGNPKVNQIVEDILSLNLLEVADLTEILQKKLGVTAGGFGPAFGQGQQVQQVAAAAEPAAKEPEPEKTEFDVKLQGFDAAAKIKVIKEVRGITALGLKEAKELVEKAPVVVKAGVAKAEAEDMLKKIEAVGGKVELV